MHARRPGALQVALGGERNLLQGALDGQGRSAAGNLVGTEGWRFVDDVPTGIYTIPEISSLGKTERELTLAMLLFGDHSRDRPTFTGFDYFVGGAGTLLIVLFLFQTFRAARQREGLRTAEFFPS